MKHTQTALHGLGVVTVTLALGFGIARGVGAQLLAQDSAPETVSSTSSTALSSSEDVSSASSLSSEIAASSESSETVASASSSDASSSEAVLSESSASLRPGIHSASSGQVGAHDSSSSEASAEPSSASSESSASSVSSDRLAELRNRLIDRSGAAGVHANIAPSFVIPTHPDIADAEELKERVTMTLVNVKGETLDVEFTVTDEGSGYRVTLIPPRVFTPGQYRLIASLDRTRGLTRALQHFFRMTGEGDKEEDDVVLLDEFVEWGMTTTNADEESGSQESGEMDLINVTRDAVSQAKPGVTETMTINVTTDVDMTGTVREVVPSVFTNIETATPATISKSEDAMVIEWSTSFIKGETRAFTYTFTTPTEQPVFTLFGPVEIRGTPMDMQEAAQDAVLSDSSASSLSSESAESSASSEISSSSSSSSESSDSSEQSSASSASSVPSLSSISSFSSISSESSEESAEPSSESPLGAFFTHLLASITFDEDEIFFTEDTQWQMLVSDGAFLDDDRNRLLMLERTQAVFDANAQPTFTLVQTELPADDASILDDEGNLDDTVAMQEVIKTVVTDEQMQDAVVTQILKDDAQNVASQTLEDRDTQRELEEASGNTTAVGLQNLVQETIETNADTQQQLTDIVTEHPVAGAIVEQVVTETLNDRIIAEFAENGTEPVDVESVISSAIDTASDDVMTLKEAVVDTVVGNAQTTGVVAENITGAQTEGAEDLPSRQAGVTVMKITLTDPSGTVIENPPVHFTVGSVQLVIDPLDHFRPGVYTLEVLVTNPLTGEVTSMYQQFAWGVLAMNTDKDIYKEGETGRIDFGVLDDRGEIVCEAELTLDVVKPDGSIEQLSTDDDSIETTGSCGLKQAGFIEPDFTTTYLFDQTGEYALKLTATTPNGVRSITNVVEVQESESFSIKRTAATRLWPFAPSPMTINVTFGADVNGSIVEHVPEGFIINSTEPEGDITKNADGSQSITWEGEWEEGETATFDYIYDAPDISPQFYLLGPVRILSDIPLETQ